MRVSRATQATRRLSETRCGRLSPSPFCYQSRPARGTDPTVGKKKLNTKKNYVEKLFFITWQLGKTICAMSGFDLGHLAETQQYLASYNHLPCFSLSTQALATLYPIPPPLHLHPSTIPQCDSSDSLTSSITSLSARILVTCANSRTPTTPHYLRALTRGTFTGP